MDNNPHELSNKLKLAILFTDYLVFSLLFLTIEYLFKAQLGLGIDYPWLFRLLIYFVFFTMMEFLFNCSLGMKLFKVSLPNRRNCHLDKAFLKYALLIIPDRFILLILVYFFRVFFHSRENLLLSEKYSGLRWVRKQ